MKFDVKTCSSGKDCLHPNGSTLPNTAEYFPIRGDGKGLRGRCRECSKAHCRQKRKENPTPQQEALKRYREKHRDMVLARDREYKKQERINNGDHVRQRERNWRKNNPEKFKAKIARNTARHRDHIRRRQHNYYLQHKHIWDASRKEWRKNNLDKARLIGRIASHKYRVKARNLPNDFSNTDWLRALTYWEYKCAYCGASEGLFKSMQLTMDHFIPVISNDCPGTIPSNIVPACLSCNGSKAHRPVEIWLIEKFGKRKATAILKRIKEYFDNLA